MVGELIEVILGSMVLEATGHLATCKRCKGTVADCTCGAGFYDPDDVDGVEDEE